MSIESSIMGFSRKFVEPFDSLTSKRYSKTSKYNPSKSSSKATIGGGFLEVLMYIVNVALKKDEKLAIGSVGDKNTYVCEYLSRTGNVDIAVYSSDGECKAAIYNAANSSVETYQFSTGSKNGNAVIAAMFPEFMKDNEFKEHYLKFKEMAKDEFPNLLTAAEEVGIMCDNVYYRLKDPSCPMHIKFNEPNDEMKLKLIRTTSIKSGSIDPDALIVGNFSVLSNPSKVTSKASSTPEAELTFEDMIGKYQINPDREFTDSEMKNMEINKIDNYLVQDIDVEICNLIKETSNTNVPFRTFTFTGEAGSGKSTKARAIASFVKLPFVLHTCSVNTEIFDFIGQVMPASAADANSTGNEILDKLKKEKDGITYDTVAKVLELPTVDDITFDPAMAYEDITGKTVITIKDEVSEEQLYKIDDEEKSVDHKRMTQLAMTAWSELMSKKFSEVLEAVKQDGGTNFIYTETDFIRAIKYGWVCEVQEPNVIMSEGVLVGLNGLLQEGTITLPTGEVIKKHPDCIIIFTTNVDYSGCRAMNQSVIDRSNALYSIEAPSAEEMATRAMLMSGNTDFDMVLEMAEVVRDIAETMKTNAIEDGVCGPRSLANWAAAARYMDPYKAFISCVLSKTSMDEESRLALKKRIDESSFKPIKKRKRI